jgi:Fe-S cluster assembly ATP-binding protein
MKTRHILSVEHLSASVAGKQILSEVSMTVKSGEVHVLMGPNGSGKSTLAYALLGHPAYSVQLPQSKIVLDKKNLAGFSTEKRALEGLFLAFQAPISVPGVTVLNLLRTAYQQMHSEVKNKKPTGIQNPLLNRRWSASTVTLPEFMTLLKKNASKLKIDEALLSRGINDGFSGGEKKKLEMLQALVLEPKFAVFDEIDTGLDVDALRLVAGGIDLLASRGTGVIIITHYQRILKYVKPDVVHILIKGKLIKTGNANLAREIEEEGYAKYSNS